MLAAFSVGPFCPFLVLSSSPSETFPPPPVPSLSSSDAHLALKAVKNIFSSVEVKVFWKLKFKSIFDGSHIS